MELQAYPKRLVPHVDERALHDRHTHDFTGPSPADYEPRGTIGEEPAAKPGTEVRFKGTFFGSYPRFRAGESAGIDSPGPAYFPAAAAEVAYRQTYKRSKRHGGPRPTFGTAPKLRSINPYYISKSHAATEHTGHDGPGPGGYYMSSSEDESDAESKRSPRQPHSARGMPPRPDSRGSRPGSQSARGSRRPRSARAKRATTGSGRMQKLKRADAYLSHRVSGPRGGTFSRTSRDGAKRIFIGKEHVDLSVDRHRHLYPAPNQHNKLPGSLGLDREQTRALTGQSPRAVFGSERKCVAEKDNKLFLTREQRRARFGVEGPGPAAHSPRVGFLHEMDQKARALGFGGTRVGTAPTGRMRGTARRSSSKKGTKGGRESRVGSGGGAPVERGDRRAQTTSRVKRRIGTFGTGPRLAPDFVEREAKLKPGPADYDDAIAMAVGDSLGRTTAMERREAEDMARRREVLRASGRMDESRRSPRRAYDPEGQGLGGGPSMDEREERRMDEEDARKLALSIARGSPHRGRRAPAYSFGTSTREHPYLTVLDAEAVKQPAPPGARGAGVVGGGRVGRAATGGESPRARALRESARNRERAGATSAVVAAVTGSVGLMGGVSGPSGRPRFSARSSGRFGTTSLQRH